MASAIWKTVPRFLTKLDLYRMQQFYSQVSIQEMMKVSIHKITHEKTLQQFSHNPQSRNNPNDYKQ